MHYNFETKAALGPSLGFWEMKGGVFVHTHPSPRQRRKRLLWTRGVGAKVVLAFLGGKGVSDRMGALAGSERTAVCLEGT